MRMSWAADAVRRVLSTLGRRSRLALRTRPFTRGLQGAYCCTGQFHLAVDNQAHRRSAAGREYRLVGHAREAVSVLGLQGFAVTPIADRT